MHHATLPSGRTMDAALLDEIREACVDYDGDYEGEHVSTFEDLRNSVESLQLDVTARDRLLAGKDEEIALLRDELRTEKAHVLNLQCAMHTLADVSTKALMGVVAV